VNGEEERPVDGDRQRLCRQAVLLDGHGCGGGGLGALLVDLDHRLVHEIGRDKVARISGDARQVDRVGIEEVGVRGVPSVAGGGNIPLGCRLGSV
jgi:hypothetical protein